LIACFMSSHEVIDEGVVICSSALKVLSNVYRLAIKK
jgi:hypothetical protein